MARQRGTDAGLTAMTINESVLYQPDEKPSHPASLLHGFQNVMPRMAAMAAVTAIVATAGGQSDEYLTWIFFGVFIVCGLGHILQTFRVWRFGSGYSLSVASGTVFIAVCIAALLEGGPAMLSTLIVISSLIQFAFIWRLSLLRRIITPMVTGTVLMLLSAVVISVVMGRLSDIPEGAPIEAAVIVAGATFAILLGMRLFAPSRWQQWAPVVAILSGCAIAVPFGLLDLQSVRQAAWVGMPTNAWPGFDLSFGAKFWALLPGFVIVNLANTITTISETVTIQQIAWRRPRATDFRVVQGAQNLVVLTNLLAACIGALPNRLGAGNSARGLLTGVYARRMGVYAGIILIVVAFLPKVMALIAAIPRPILTAYIAFLVALLFTQGMRMVVQDEFNVKKASIVGVSFWLGMSFQNGLIFPDLLSGTLGTLLGSGITTGAVCVILLSLLLDASSPKRKRLNTEMSMSSLPQIDAFLQDVGQGEGWDEESVGRLRSAGEETLSSMISQGGAGETGSKQRLTVSARRVDEAIEFEFLAASEGADNLEDRIAYLSDEPELRDDWDVSFRLLRHYASSVEHRKYHDIDIITVRVDGTSG